MSTTDLSVPEEFRGYIGEDDIPELTPANKKILLALSVHAQWIDWLVEGRIQDRAIIRQLDAEIARLKLKLAEQTLTWKILRYTGLAIGAGALSYLGQLLIGKK